MLTKQKENLILSDYFIQPNNVKANVLILGLRSFADDDFSVFNKVLSDFLRNNGALANYVVCDNVLECCDLAQKGTDSQEKFCKKCKDEREDFYRLYKNDYLLYSDFITREEKDNLKRNIESLSDDELFNFSYLDVKVSQHAMDSTARYFKRGGFDKKNKEYLRLFRKNIIQGVISVFMAEKIYEKEKPTHLVSQNGCWTAWGPFCDYMRTKGVHITIYIKAAHQVGGFMFSTHCSPNFNFSKEDSNALWESFNKIDLKQGQKDELREFFENKKTNKTLDYRLYRDGQNSGISDDKIEELLKDKNKRKFVLYPNLLWNVGAGIPKSNAFNDVFEWLFETIEFFKNNEKYILFVKPHPAEALWDYTETGIKELILSRFEKLPGNIILLPKEYPVSSFGLMEKNCIGITYNGTVGMEHSYFKKPILVGGKALYSDPGVVLKVESKEHYFDLIRNSKPLYEHPIDNYNVIEKFTYFYFFGFTVSIPFMRKDKWDKCIDWDILNNYEGFVKGNKTMNNVSSSIIDKGLILNTNIN